MTGHHETLIGYVRTSAHEPNQAAQEAALRQTGCRTIFTDAGVGAGCVIKPGLASALNACGPGSELVVWRLDRLARSIPDFLTLGLELQQRGIDLTSLEDRFSTTDPARSGFLIVYEALGRLAEHNSLDRLLLNRRTDQRERRPGRPGSMNDESWATAHQLLTQSPPHSVSEAAALLKVSRQALYRQMETRGLVLPFRRASGARAAS